MRHTDTWGVAWASYPQSIYTAGEMLMTQGRHSSPFMTTVRILNFTILTDQPLKCARHRPTHTHTHFHVSLAGFLPFSLSLSLSPLAPQQPWLVAFESQQQIWFLPWVLWAGCHAHKAKQLAPVCQNSLTVARNSYISMYFATTAKATTTITTETTSRKAFQLQFGFHFSAEIFIVQQKARKYAWN